MPWRAICSSTDSVLVAAEEAVGRQWCGSVREHGAMLDEGLVSNGTIGDEDERLCTNMECHHGPILTVEFLKGWFNVQN